MPSSGRRTTSSSQTANRPRNRNDDELIEVVNNFVPGEEQDWASFVGKFESVPANLASFHFTSSQPSASHASMSSSLENSP